MNNGYRQKRRLLSLLLVITLVWTTFGFLPAPLNASGPDKVVLVGDLQAALGHSTDWDPAADITEMTSHGNGYYSYTANLPAGTYQYKVAVNGTWDESYGFSSYTHPAGSSQDGNILLELGTDSAVTFYYNHMTHKIADSTYYTPLAAGQLPRVTGDLQTALGDADSWQPGLAQTVLEDADFDQLYTAVKDVPAGSYNYKIVLGPSWDDSSYPDENQSLVLPQQLPVTFSYHAVTHEVSASYAIPPAAGGDQVPAGHLRIHYSKADQQYDNLGLWLWDHVAAPSTGWPVGAAAFPAANRDSYGAYIDVPLAANASRIGFLVVNRSNGDKEGGDKTVLISTGSMNEIWVKEGSDQVYAYEPVDLPENTVRIHYTRGDNSYAPYGLWLWNDVTSPSENWPAGAAPFDAANVDRYGGYVDVPLAADAQKIGFIVVNRTSGDKDGGDKAFSLLGRYKHLWIKQGDDTVYVSPYGEVASGLVSAEILSESKLLLTFTLTDGLEPEGLKDAIQLTDKFGGVLPVQQAVIKSATTVEVTTSLDLDHAPISVTYSGKTVEAAVGWRMLDELYSYEGDDLGATYNEGNVTLKLWAPKASAVTANVYDKNDATLWIGSVDLTLGSEGVWSAQLAPADLGSAGVTDLRGYYYQYEVTNDGVTKKVLDPYAKSMAPFRVNSEGQPGPDQDIVGKAAIVDLSRTEPSSTFGYASIEGYEKREDAVIWEAHIRDLTSDPAIEGDLNARWGSYSAFKDKLAYMKSLGITHIQLLPIMAWYYGDELSMDQRELDYSSLGNEYNWGYDPHNYFTPDGAYSENAADPELRIKELKGLIDAIHEAGMGVILDVVYTHMAKADFLNDIVPNYYAFQKPDGSFIGGFGNNLATNHKMAEKLMVDSVKYWFEEYKIDGMRWDMMGDATYDAVQKAVDAAAAINPNALFIGEGWRTFAGHEADPSLAGKGADQDWMDKTDSVGVFSDEIRNELKSGYGSEGEPRFITGGARSIQTILNNIKAQPSNTPADDPGDIVPYIEAHDNLPLYDVIAQSIKKDPSLPANDLEIHKRIRLGNTLVLTSQGTAFLHAGQEYGRTKQWLAPGIPEHKYHTLVDEAGQPFTYPYFIHDSYDSSDAINRFDWAKATNATLYPVNTTTRDYTAGLIALRKQTDAFRLGDQELVNSNVTLIESPEVSETDLVIGYKNRATDGTGNYYVFVNADHESRTLTLSEDLTSGTVVVDNDEAGTQAVSAPSGFVLTANSITLEPLTAVVIQVAAEAPVLTAIELGSPSYTLQIGQSQQLAVFAKYSDGSRRNITKLASFASNQSSTAAVTAGGKITAMKDGNAVITVAYQGMTVEAAVTVTAGPQKRYVQINYFRPDQSYEDWNMWVWNTGVKDDQILFDGVVNGKATVLLEIADNATGVGFVLRKGTDWNTAKQDIPDDRIIPIAPGALFTKVNITSMVSELDVLPAISGPVLQDGGITFLYRDDSLFRDGQMSQITGVKVKVNGVLHDMVYDAAKEWFIYTLGNLQSGTYEYTFLVEQGGAAAEITDPKNTVNGKSIVIYKKPSVVMTSTVHPSAVSYAENAVLTISATPSEELAFVDGYMDLSSIGGREKVAFDTLLMAQSISVKDTITAGVKSIPVTLIDEYGNKHHHTATVNVKARTSTGSLDFDWDEARIYFVLTDRFQDGDTANNADVDKSHPEAYHGGDFQGLIDKLDYMKKLGINTLWITPIVDNIDFNKGADFGSKQYGYHGYWAKDFTKLDEHLGDMDTFKELIEKAHDQGIKIMVDVVLNHTGYGLKPDDDSPGITEEDKARFAGMLRTNGVQSSTNPIEGELAYLPDFKTEEQAVREQIIAWQAGWLERVRTDRGDTIDYFRVDTVKHVENTTWKAFKNALTAIDPKFKLIGEYYGATADSDGGMLRSGMMDGLLDFGFKDRARQFVNGEIEAVDAYLADRESKMDNTSTMGQFLSSHDENGFLSHYVDGDKGKLKAAAALQITAKGQPVIYYGEELRRSGANAGDMSAGQFSENRDDMPWELLEEEQALHEHYTKLLQLRGKFSKLYAKGTRTKLAGSDELGYLAFNKQYGGENIVTVINTNVESIQITIPVPFVAGTEATDEYSGEVYSVSASKQVTLQLPGRNDGGTVILSGVSQQQSSPGSSGTSGSAGALQPASEIQKVEEGSLKPGEKGKATIQLQAGKKAVQLPIQAASMLGGQDFELVVSDSLTVTLPNAVLKQLSSLASGSEADGAYILFRISQLQSDEESELLDRMNAERAEWRSASRIYNYELVVRLKDGSEKRITQFDKPVQLAIKPDNTVNQTLIGIYYIGENGEREYMGGSPDDGGTWRAEVKHFSRYAALELDKSFTDVAKGHWASTAIKALAAKHVVTGVSDTSYAPNARVTRAEFAAMLVRMLGVELDSGSAGQAAFTDVGSDKWYAAYVAAAGKLGIVKGRSETIFAPNAPISREEMAVMILRAWEAKDSAAGSAAASASATASDRTPVFADQAKISDWAKTAVDSTAELKLVQGRPDGSFGPKDNMTRAESAQVIYNLLTR